MLIVCLLGAWPPHRALGRWKETRASSCPQEAPSLAGQGLLHPRRQRETRAEGQGTYICRTRSQGCRLRAVGASGLERQEGIRCCRGPDRRAGEGRTDRRQKLWAEPWPGGPETARHRALSSTQFGEQIRPVPQSLQLCSSRPTARPPGRLPETRREPRWPSWPDCAAENRRWGLMPWPHRRRTQAGQRA